MSNFKSGSGNLDFGGSDEEDTDPEPTAETSQTTDKRDEDAEPAASERSTSASSDNDNTLSNSEVASSQSATDRVSAGESTAAGSSAEEYPYFVRRSNVGDERDTRLEIHVRDKVADQEAMFRNELAEHLDANEISKTDAREFALLAAFHHPERVAELMQDEGFGTLD